MKGEDLKNRGQEVLQHVHKQMGIHIGDGKIRKARREQLYRQENVREKQQSLGE